MFGSARQGGAKHGYAFDFAERFLNTMALKKSYMAGRA
jgi:hypothetical protein